eukprot:INCI14617.1.p1 GENE.INCI14617.1~~INCI14617.1.p1  ORF type:complete len:141 (-),score=35.46 INCI14617.1:305-727(-)
MLQRAVARAAVVARVPRLATRASAPRRALSSANGAVKGGGPEVKTLGGRQVRVKVSPEEVAQKQQDEMFKDVLLYRMVQKIPVKNQHLRTIIASLIFIGVIISPKLIGKAKKKGEGYLDMELPDDVVEAREKQGRQAQQQ